MECPQCKDQERQNKDGFTEAGSQRYRRQKCGARYTPKPKPQGYALWHVFCDHDLGEIISVALRRLFGSNNANDVKQEIIDTSLRFSY